MENITHVLQLNRYRLESRVCHLSVKGSGKSFPSSGFQGGGRRRVGRYQSTSPGAQPCAHTCESHPCRLTGSCLPPGKAGTGRHGCSVQWASALPCQAGQEVGMCATRVSVEPLSPRCQA